MVNNNSVNTVEQGSQGFAYSSQAPGDSSPRAREPGLAVPQGPGPGRPRSPGPCPQAGRKKQPPGQGSPLRWVGGGRLPAHRLRPRRQRPGVSPRRDNASPRSGKAPAPRWQNRPARAAPLRPYRGARPTIRRAAQRCPRPGPGRGRGAPAGGAASGPGASRQGEGPGHGGGGHCACASRPTPSAHGCVTA